MTGSDVKAPDSINILPALTGKPEKPLRADLVLAPQKRRTLPSVTAIGSTSALVAAVDSAAQSQAIMPSVAAEH
jgi:hypothetical protein